MKIVIDIPDKYYDLLPEIMNGSISCNVILECVKGGQPLPKGHGRLIDESKITACNWDGKRMCCNAPTVIKADAACLSPEKLNKVKQDFKQDLNKSDEINSAIICRR